MPDRSPDGATPPVLTVVPWPQSHTANWLVLFLLAAIVPAVAARDWGMSTPAMAMGVAVACFTTRPPRAALSLAAVFWILGAIVAGLVLGDPWLAATSSLAAVAGSLLAASLIRAAGVVWMASPLDLVVLGSVVALVGALLASAHVVVGWVPADAWIGQWLALSAGMALAAPGLMVDRPLQWAHQRSRYVEAALLVALSLALAALAFTSVGGQIVGSAAAQYFLLPVLLWIAVRFGLRLTAAVAALEAVILVSTGASGMGALLQDTTLPWVGRFLTAAALIAANLLVYAVAVLEEARRTDQAALRESQDLVASLLSNSDALVAVTEYPSRRSPGRIRLASPTLLKVLGKSRDEVVGRTWVDVLGEPLGRDFLVQDAEIRRGGRARVFSTRMGESGRRRHFMTTKFPLTLRDAAGRGVGMVAVDVTDYGRRERMLRLTFNDSPVPMALLTASHREFGPIAEANAALAGLLQVEQSDLPGRDLRDFFHPAERDIAWPHEVSISEQRHVPRECRIVTSDGDVRWVAVTARSLAAPDNPDEIRSTLVVLQDVTARRHAEQTLTHQARHDALTGLPNRYALPERLQSALQRLWRSPSFVAVLFCDLDGFKAINDTMGHAAGDKVLVSVADRLRAAVRPQDTVARHGGDEFVVIAEDLNGMGEARDVAQRLRDALRAPIRVGGREVRISASVGVSVTTDPETDADELLRRADLAMYRAKDKGRNRVEAFEETMHNDPVAAMEIREKLQVAMGNGSVTVQYQPIVDVRRRVVTGAEALIRFPQEQVLTPAEFIAVAERTGLIVPLGDMVLDLALDEAVAWQQQGLDLRVHVNVSPQQLATSRYAEGLFERVMKRGLRPSALCLEITESAVLDAEGPALQTLRRLRTFGIQVGIDDFGTGYSSLTGVKNIDADYLKIDRSFVAGVTSSVEDRVIVATVVSMAHQLHRSIVAEGVESPEQLATLAELGCDEVQGFLFSTAVPAADFPALVTTIAAGSRR